MVVLEIVGFSLAVAAICAALLLFLMGGLNYQRAGRRRHARP